MPVSNFLPEDYLAQKAERRTNFICLILFGVVMIAVFGAFLVTNRQWSSIKDQQKSVNAQYQEAAQQIQLLNELEQQKSAMLERAELASALVERVPRSILLAELVNRMPPRLSLLEFKLNSEKLKPPAPPKKDKGVTGDLKPQRAPTKEEAAEEIKKIVAPRYRVEITLKGVAPSDLEVSRYLAELNAYDLIQNVFLVGSEDEEIEGQMMRQFSIKMLLSPEADIRDVEPLLDHERVRNPMSNELILSAPGSTDTVLVPPPDGEGD